MAGRGEALKAAAAAASDASNPSDTKPGEKRKRKSGQITFNSGINKAVKALMEEGVDFYASLSFDNTEDDEPQCGCTPSEAVLVPLFGLLNSLRNDNNPKNVESYNEFATALCKKMVR